MTRRAAAFVAIAMLAAPASAQVRDQTDVLQLMAASGFSISGGKVVNGCGHATSPKVKFIDLNGDGREEALTVDADPRCYGPDPGVQSKLLARRSSGRWDVLVGLLGTVKPLPTRSHGWTDFAIAVNGCEIVYRYDGQRYAGTGCPTPGGVAAAPADPSELPAPGTPPVAAASPAAPVAPPAAPAGDLATFPETYGSFAAGGDCSGLPRVTVSASEIRLDTAAGSRSFPRPMVMTGYMGPEDQSITYYLQGKNADPMQYSGLIVSIEVNRLWSGGGDNLSAEEKAVDRVASAEPMKRCGAQLAEPAPEAPPQMRATAATSPDDLQALGFGYLQDPGFAAAYARAAGKLLDREPWLTDLVGPGDTKVVTLAGQRYFEVQSCKPHDCGDNSMVAIYEPRSGALYGLVTIARRPVTFGKPPKPIEADLKRLWRAAWPNG